MFDSAPPNLPVEPAPKTPPATPQMPTAPTAPMTAPQAMVVGQIKKEPEDIFKDLDTAGQTAADTALMPEFESASRKSPVKLIGFIVGGLVVLGGIGFAAWYFMLRPKPAVPVETAALPAVETPKEQIETPPPMPETPVTTPPAGVNIPAPQSIAPPTNATGTSPETQPTATQPEAAPASVAGTAPVEGTDTDQDSLTDAEEALLGTDPANKDTNGNSYPDGTEVLNQYDPLKKGAPLAESSKLKWFEWEGLKMLAPAGWQLMTDPLRPDVTTLDTGNVAKFVIQNRGDMGNRSLRGWLALADNDTSMKVLKPKAGWEALQTADGLTTYVAVNGTIYIITYELNGAPTYEYRTLFTLLANSLQAIQ